MILINEKDWQIILNEYKESGLPQKEKEFCKVKGLLLGQFEYRWRKRLRERRNEGIAKSSRLSNGFEVVATAPNEAEGSKPGVSIVTLDFPNQVRCKLQLDFRRT
ncbi:IS66 family insertion sequence element accessory protein TnpA [Legionella pneumophila]|uniref:IS66 family insertion sequence element accessory protein TnpA n=1 Tax=Legionella pneumophila TaxID=446 RepID=UPI000875C387|nr:hypothetical protein [Legionella pneumophila]AOW59450.1 hypothetical protein BE843_14835 [Legionella pneumophila subsp. pneumophila]AOW60362.1 hypothetical protein BE844_03940 [Legionella pneumophila subsp. pneumophila]AOW65760.1 hypothetical protein BE846_01705 [Legionella pneumophila subsp. pneumophila]HEE0245795.1 hypothetical protein [Legionella pneumophila]